VVLTKKRESVKNIFVPHDKVRIYIHTLQYQCYLL